MPYRPEVLEQLARHGVRPDPTTPPSLVRSFVSRLYRYEIRGLRDRVRAGVMPAGELAAQVITLRRRYPVLSLPLAYWTE